MEKVFRSWDVEETWLLPPSVKDFVPEGHPAHMVRDTVCELLDLSAIEEPYGELRGYPPYHPAMMTALLLYAYTNGVYSSRRIARACEERVDFMAITAMQRPDFRTVSEFRRKHLKALGELFVQVLRLCARAGLVQLGHVALDGTKIRANASKHKAMSYGRMKTDEPKLEAEVSEWFSRAEKTDAAEDVEHGSERRGDEAPEWVKNKQRRLEKLRQAKAELEAEARQDKSGGKAGPLEPPAKSAEPKDSAQRNFTDPDSRIMNSHDGFIQAYNCQAAVDADSHVIVAQGLTNNASDAPSLTPLLKQIKLNTRRQAGELSADAGYCSESNLATLRRHHVRAYVGTGRQKHGSGSPTWRHPGRPGSLVRAMALKLRRGGHRSRYRLRKQTAEPVFGQIKSARGFRQFLLRGIEKVKAEWSLLCTAHNLLKLARAAA
jgi:transposase